jgi:hypothetical protein
MFITITIDTDHPEAWDNLRADLESLVEDRDEDGTAYANGVYMSETAHLGGARLRTFTAERDPAEPDAEAKSCTETASCEEGDHTYSWPCDLARTDA